MKIKTFYISEDNIYFTDLNDCVDYENEFYNVLKKAEQDNLGERLQHKMFEPCLETKKHSLDNILKMVNILCVCLSSKISEEPKDEFKQAYKKIADIHRWIDEIYNDKNCDVKSNFLYIKNWLNILRNRCFLKYDNVYDPVNYHKIYVKNGIFSRIVDRIGNISVVTGIEYPDSKWVYREYEWEEHCKFKKNTLQATENTDKLFI